MEGTINSDSGAMIRDGIKSTVKQGICSEKTWPYVIGQFKKKPPSQAYVEALSHQVTVYSSIISLNDMKQCLAQGFPFVFGFTVYESFESDVVAKTGVVPMPKRGESVLGGHAVVAVGYDDSTQRFMVRNSWGKGWGLAGYCTMPYQYLNSRLASDMWRVTAEKC